MSWFLVASGGAIGAVLRYSFSVWMMPLTQGQFPWATWWVNILGCGLAGIFLAMSEKFPVLQGNGRLLVVVGILGGFTTFSSFGLETFNMLRHDDLTLALTYVGSSLLCGFSALSILYYLSRQVLF